MLESLLSLAFLLALAGAISFLILVGKVIARMIKGPPPVDPDPPPALRRSYSAYINAILVVLVILGAISSAFIYVVGSALASL